MSYGAWEAGKGYKSRVSDYKKYSVNIDNIKNFGKNRMKCLFLDDIRLPMNANLWASTKENLIDASRIQNWQWTIVRSYDEFVKYLTDNGVPDVVSFDNDLIDICDENLSLEDVDRRLSMSDWENVPEKTGAHCAKLLVEKCMETKSKLPKWYIHTANLNAAKIIEQILKDAEQNL